MAQQEVPDIMNNHAVAWLIVIPICSLETVACLFAIASRTHWKCPDVLLFSFVFIQLLYLMIPMLIYSINVKRNDLSIGVCRLVVWCVLSFRIMMSLHMTYLAMDRVWILKWPRAYHLHNTNRQSCKNSIFMWLFGMSMGAIGLSNWRDESDQELFLKCGLVLYTPNYVYSLCVIIIILGSLVLGVMCVGTLVVDTIRTHKSESSIPTIIIQDEIGKKTQTVKVAKEEQNRQVNKIVCMIFSVYYVISVLPFVIVNLYSLANHVDTWMPIVIQWCTLIGYVINPILMGVVCDRYRKGYIRCLGNLGCVMDGKSEHNRFVPRQETLDSLDNVPSAEDKIEFHSPVCDVDPWDEDIENQEQHPHGSSSPPSLTQRMNTLIIPNEDSFVVPEENEKEEATFENETYEKEVKESLKNEENAEDFKKRKKSRQSRENNRRQKRKLSNEEKIRRAKERYRRSKYAENSENNDDVSTNRISCQQSNTNQEVNFSDSDTYNSISSFSQSKSDNNTSTDASSSNLYDIPEETLDKASSSKTPYYPGDVRTMKMKPNSQKYELKTISGGSHAGSIKTNVPSDIVSDGNRTGVKISAREMREKFRESRQEANVINSSSSTNSDTIIYV